MQSLHTTNSAKAIAVPHEVDMPMQYWAQRAVEHRRWAFAVRVGAYAGMIAVIYWMADLAKFDAGIWPLLTIMLPLPFKPLSTVQRAVVRGEGESQYVQVRSDEAMDLENVQPLRTALFAEIAILTFVSIFALPHAAGWLAGIGAAIMAVTASNISSKHWEDELYRAIRAAAIVDGQIEITIKNGFGGANFDD